MRASGDLKCSPVAMQHRKANDWWTVCAALGFTGARDEAVVSSDPDTTGQ